MSQIRKAHSVEILDRRLSGAEGGVVDAMELVGIYDELSRVERKWLSKAAEVNAGRVMDRPLADAAKMNQRFDRLARLVQAKLRQASADPAEQLLLRRTSDTLQARQPLPVV